MQITFRNYQKEDFKALESIIRETWNYDKFSSPKTAGRLARVFLRSCLTNYTFSKVAVIDGKPSGIILVNHKKKHKCPTMNRIRQIQALLPLYLSREGRRVFKIFGNVNGIDKELLAECKKEYPAELALFAVDPCRGLGVGKTVVSCRTGLYETGTLGFLLSLYRYKLQLWILRAPKHEKVL